MTGIPAHVKRRYAERSTTDSGTLRPRNRLPGFARPTTPDPGLTGAGESKMSETRFVLLSGCSSGFGFRAARELARRGHKVFAGFRDPAHRNADRAQALTTFARQGGFALETLRLDVDDDGCVRTAVEQVLQRSEGRLDVLVNTAAYSVMGPLEACQPEQLLAELNTNVVGALRLFRAVLPVMRRAGRGRILQVTSGLGRAAVPFMGPYGISAWAQECFAEVLSYEAGAFGVEVGILEPGAYHTDLGGPAVKPVGDADRLAVYEPQLIAFAETLQANDQPKGDPEEVARAVADAVEAESVPLRTVIGESARELVRLRTESTTGEFKAAIIDKTGLAPFQPGRRSDRPRS